MKLRHFILFFIACIALIFSDLPSGPLLALFAWLQVYNLWTQNVFNKKTQLWAFLVFLSSAPFVFLWGGVYSLLLIYIQEKQFLFSSMALAVDLGMCMLATIYFIFCFEVASAADFEVVKSIKLALDSIKMKKPTFFKISGLFLIFSFIPLLSVDWKIIFSIMATQLYLRRSQLKQVFGSAL